jgi:hypothetical protein
VPSPTSLPPLDAVDTAHQLTWLARGFAAAFESFEVAGRDAAPSRRPPLARAGRVLGELALTVADLVPESVLLADARNAGAAAPLDLPSEPAKMIEALELRVGSLLARAGPVADGAFERWAGHALIDLQVIRATC